MPPSKVGRCTVFGELAAGGMATVFVGRLAGAAGFARRVAIKSLHAQYAKDPDFLAMFLDEARLSGRIQHPNVVRVLDVIASESELYLVLEYIEGEALSKLVRLLRARGDFVPVAISVAILIGVLDGLHAAHGACSEDGQPLEIVHRDVSPQNVLVGIDGLPRILDFGIAKAVGRMQTTRGDQLKGKLAYMAPEHLAREGLDRRADVYAAGILLWELLTGARLFQADDEISTFRRALEAKVEPPSSVRPELPKDLDRVVLRALAKSPSERFQTARDFSYELEKSGLAASLRDVSAWVQATAGDSLRERAARLAEYEASHEASRPFTAVDADSSPSTVFPDALAARLRAGDAATAMLATPAERKPTLPSRGWLGAAALMLLLAALGVSRLFRDPTESVVSTTDAAASMPRMPVEVAPPPAPIALSAMPTVEPAGQVPAVSGAETEARRGSPARAAAPAAPPRQPIGKAAPHKKRNCETPFTVDAHGVRVPKLECL